MSQPPYYNLNAPGQHPYWYGWQNGMPQMPQVPQMPAMPTHVHPYYAHYDMSAVCAPGTELVAPGIAVAAPIATYATSGTQPITAPIVPVVPNVPGFPSTISASQTASVEGGDGDNSVDANGDDASSAAEKAKKEKSKRLEVHGNDNMNLNHILISNIKASDYFKSLYIYPTYEEIIHLISEITYLDPWVPKTKVPSSAFCLLFKLYTLKLTEKQMRKIVEHDCPMVRATGYLYLRLCYPPKKLWEDWFQYSISDEELFEPFFNSKPVTMYYFCKKLLTDFHFCDMLFPRIPIPVENELSKLIKEAEKQYAEDKAAEEEELRKEEKQQLEKSPPKEESKESRKKRRSRSKSRSRSRDRKDRKSRSSRKHRSRSRSPRHRRSRSRSRSPRHRRSRSPRRSSPRRRRRSPSPAQPSVARPQNPSLLRPTNPDLVSSGGHGGASKPSATKAGSASAAFSNLMSLYSSDNANSSQDSYRRRDSNIEDTIVLGSRSNAQSRYMELTRKSS